MDDSLKNIALLIDADNTTPAGIDPVLTALAELGKVNIRRAYGNWAKRSLANWSKLTNDYGIRPQQQFDLTKGKNATDMAMTIDAIDLLYQGKVDGFGIMSSDSDFTPLVSRLRQDGLVVYGFGSEQRAPKAFQTACTRFVDIDALIRGDQLSADDSKVPADSVPVDEDIIALLGKAWKASRRDETGYARVSEVGQIADNRSSFDVRNYGFKRLTDLLASLPNFDVQRRDGQSYVRRLR